MLASSASSCAASASGRSSGKEGAFRAPSFLSHLRDLLWLSSFVVGYASIAWLLRFVAKHNITVFIWYRVALAAVIAVLLVARQMLSQLDFLGLNRELEARVAARTGWRRKSVHSSRDISW